MHVRQIIEAIAEHIARINLDLSTSWLASRTYINKKLESPNRSVEQKFLIEFANHRCIIIA